MRTYSLKEELVNSLTHGAGLALSIVAVAALVSLACVYGTVWHIVSFSVYGASLAILYTASTLYHSFRSLRIKEALRIVDHSSIYLLIAGTYTPVGLITLHGAWGWSLFGAIWGLAAAGILLQTLMRGRFRAVEVALYAVMGWSVLVAFKPLLARMGGAGVAWLLAGGLCYTVGIAFYALKRMPYHHAVWHLMVLAGSACHFLAVLLYILPARP